MSDDKPESPEPVVTDNTDRHRFEISVAGRVAGFVDYERREGEVEMTHAEIHDGHEGEGLGSILVAAALDAVRADGLLVVPTCPFVAKYVQRHDEYADLVAPGR